MGLTYGDLFTDWEMAVAKQVINRFQARNWSADYFDGMGRVVQTQAEGESGYNNHFRYCRL